MNRTQAEDEGYTVDDTCYPWIAYKGPRFKPSEYHRIPTDKETLLAGALRDTFTEYKKGTCVIDASICIRAREALAAYEADRA